MITGTTTNWLQSFSSEFSQTTFFAPINLKRHGSTEWQLVSQFHECNIQALYNDQHKVATQSEVSSLIYSI